ncbi:MAG: hypothetical protein U5K38_03220 [Woeseiaceae bacterium]|nr:hypothetical protein [Woeseiaceae bacterium]
MRLLTFTSFTEEAKALLKYLVQAYKSLNVNTVAIADFDVLARNSSPRLPEPCEAFRRSLRERFR